MARTKGFFSIVQFCPDLDRGECVNVGVVLVIPILGFRKVLLSEDNEGPKQRFGRDAYDDVRLTVAKRALASRIEQEIGEWGSSEELTKFGKKEGNNLLLSAPRLILVEDAEIELTELFQRLVHVDPNRRRRQPKPDLKSIFEPKLLGVPLLRDLEIDIPEYGRLEVPYAYRNGVLNLVRPEGFPIDVYSSTTKANDLAVKGHLLFNHPDQQGKTRKLVVIGGFDNSAPEDLKHRIEFVLKEHDARLVREDRLDEFVAEVRRDAHS
jgi:hypothetical protein